MRVGYYAVGALRMSVRKHPTATTCSGIVLLMSVRRLSHCSGTIETRIPEPLVRKWGSAQISGLRLCESQKQGNLGTKICHLAPRFSRG